MDINKINLKKSLVAGSAMAVMSGFVPPIAMPAKAGTATIPWHVQIVTQVTLANTNTLDFGRLAITNVAGITGNHTLSPAGATTTATNASVAVAGSPGNFDVTAGTGANNVTVSATGANNTYNAGAITLNRFTLSGGGAGDALAASVTVALGGNVGANMAGGGNTAVDVGGQITFATPGVGTYNANTIVLTITDLP